MATIAVSSSCSARIGISLARAKVFRSVRTSSIQSLFIALIHPLMVNEKL